MADGIWIPVNAEMKGFIGTIVKEASGAGKRGAQAVEKEFQTGGKRAGEAVAAGLASQAKRVEQISTKLGTARKAEAAAAADVATAEQKLNSLRNIGTAKASQIAQAEQQLATAKAKQSDASARVSREEKSLADVRNGGQGASVALSRAEDNLAKARTDQGTAFGKLQTAEMRLSEARDAAKIKTTVAQNAEQNLFKVRQEFGSGARQVAAAEKQLETAKRQSETANAAVARSEGQVAKARATLASATDMVKAKTMTHKAVQHDVAAAEKSAGNEAQSAGAKIRGLGNDMASASGSGTGFTSSLGGFAKKAALAGGAFLGVSSATSALSAGFDRLNNLQRADIMFRNIGLSADQTKEQMSQINDVITGTSVSMADAASTASMLMQAGVESGKPLNDSIKALTNISAIAGGSAQDVGMVMMQIKAAGKLLGGDAMQLQGRGINIYGYLADSLGKSFEEVKKMGEDGKISYEMVVDAINSKTGDLATEMGETLPAKMGNFKTAIASLAAASIEPLIEPAIKLVGSLTDGLKKVTPVIKVFVEKAVAGIGDFFQMLGRHQGTVTVVGIALGSLALGLAAVNLQTKLMAAGGIAGIFTKLTKAVKGSTAATWLFNSALWANPLLWWVAGIAAAVGALYLFFTRTESGREMWKKLVDGLKAGWSWISGVFAAGWRGLVDLFSKVKDKFFELKEQLFGEGTRGRSVLDSVVQAAKDAWEWLGKVKDFAGMVIDVLFKGDFTGSPFGIEEDSKIVDWLFRIRDTAIVVGDGFAKFKDAAQSVVDILFKGEFNGADKLFGLDEDSILVDWLFTLRDVAIDVKDKTVAAFDAIREAWGKMSGAIQKKYAENIRPIVEAFKEKWQEAVDTLRPAIEALRTKWGEFTSELKSKYDEHVKPAVDMLKDKFGELQDKIGEFVNKYWVPVLKPALMILAALLIGPVVLGIAAVVSAVVAVMFILGGLAYVLLSIPGWVKGAVEGAKRWLSDMKDKVGKWFSEMGEAIKTWWTDHIQPIPQRVSDAISGALEWVQKMLDKVKSAFSEMGNAVTGWWRDHVQPLPGKVADAMGKVISKIRELPGKIKAIFANAGQWLRNAGSDIINGLWNGMKGAFESVKNWLSDLPGKIRNSIGSISFDVGGMFGFAAGGITRRYVDGGIEAAEQYANGGSKFLPDTARIERPHGARGLVQWAEASTKGEAFIPLDKNKHVRSVAITNAVANHFGFDLVDSRTGEPYAGNYSRSLGPQSVGVFADGGVTGEDLKRFVQGQTVKGNSPSRPLHDAPYVRGGSNWGDCSGTVSSVAALAVGQDAFPRKFATASEASWLSRNGFKRGKGSAGDLRIGFRDGGPGGGHTSGTLPDGTNFEMGGAAGGGSVGSRAAGAHDAYYNEFFYKTVTPRDWNDPKMGGLGDIDFGGGYYPEGPTEYITADNQKLTLTADQLRAAQVIPAAEKWAAGDQSQRGAVEQGLAAAGRIGSQAAAATFAEELGNKSLVELGADAFFDFFGMGDSLTKKVLFSPVGDLVGAKGAAGSPGTSVAQTHAMENHNAAMASMTPDQMKRDPQLRGAPQEVLGQPEVPEWGPKFFVHEIARQAKTKGVGKAGAVIGVATALVESGDPLKMWANRAVPESLQFKHDAIGSDHDSVGLFQQRNNGAWGSVADRMNAYKSAGMFFDAMLRKFPNWQSMAPGAVAQGVQVSAYPGRYATKMGRAENLLSDAVFDRGGLGRGKGLLQKDIVEPERVLSPQQTKTFDHLVFDELPKQRDGGEVVLVVNIDGDEVMRKRVDVVEGRVEVNTRDLQKVKDDAARAKVSSVTSKISMMV